jgi:hypothetical protein
MVRLPEEHLEQMTQDDILWIGCQHTESDFDNERKNRGLKTVKTRH